MIVKCITKKVILSPHNAMSEDGAIAAVTKNTVEMLIEELDKRS